MALGKVAYLEVWLAHLYAEGLGLIAAGNGAAIVAREHDDRPPLKVGAEYSLTRDEEVVAVGKGKHRLISLSI